ncbi:MAG: hypothetical protein JSS79_07755 [Bacteroidetes bacterium]|nr:hypothetical protein [Bacteroidota bacterium]
MVDGKTINELKEEVIVLKKELTRLKERLDEFEKIKIIIESDDFKNYLKTRK